jgi:antitoxin VapB
MKTARTTVFKTNKSQAVRLPKAVALPPTVKEVEIVAVGEARIVTPVGHAWGPWFEGPGVSDDFMNEREQPEDQVREDM